MNFEDCYTKAKTENPHWKSPSRIMGRAGEIFCSENIKCPECNSKLSECKINQKSKDFSCKNCGKDYQVKCFGVTTREFNKYITNKKFTKPGAAYNTTITNINQNIGYICMLYDKNNLEILGLTYNNKLTSDNIIARKPLKKTAKRAGWIGCYINFTNFSLLI